MSINQEFKFLQAEIQKVKRQMTADLRQNLQSKHQIPIEYLDDIVPYLWDWLYRQLLSIWCCPNHLEELSNAITYSLDRTLLDLPILLAKYNVENRDTRWLLAHKLAPSLIDYFFEYGDENFFTAIEGFSQAVSKLKTTTKAYRRFITPFELRKAFRAHFEAEICSIFCKNRLFNEGIKIPENAWSLINLASNSLDENQKGQIYQEIQGEIQPKAQKFRLKSELSEDFTSRIYLATAEEVEKIHVMDIIERTEFIFKKGKFILDNISQRLHQEKRKACAKKRTLDRIEKSSIDADTETGYALQDTLPAPEQPSPLLLSHTQQNSLIEFYGDGADALVESISAYSEGTREQWATVSGLNLSKVKRLLKKFRDTPTVFYEITGIDENFFAKQ